MIVTILPQSMQGKRVASYNGALPRVLLCIPISICRAGASTESEDNGWATTTLGYSDATSINDGGRDLGIHFDGEGDYAEVDFSTSGEGIP